VLPKLHIGCLKWTIEIKSPTFVKPYDCFACKNHWCRLQ